MLTQEIVAQREAETNKRWEEFLVLLRANPDVVQKECCQVDAFIDKAGFDHVGMLLAAAMMKATVAIMWELIREETET